MKLLVSGANGFIGRKILDSACADRNWEVVAVSQHPDIKPSEGYSFLEADLTDPDSCAGILDRERPDVIVNTAAISVMAKCESDPEYAQRINVGLVETLAGWCAANGARLVQISTDTIFAADKKIFHKEEDSPCPPNTYGRTKAEAEKAILASGCSYAIERVVLVYGRPEAGQHGNIVKLVHDRVLSGQAVNIVDDQWRTPTYVGDVVDAALTLAVMQQSGIWHICGKECLSIYEIALKVADAYGLDKSLINPVKTDEGATGFARPIYGLLDISKAEKELGYCPKTLDEALKLFRP